MPYWTNNFNMNLKYLWILSAPCSGSTLLHELLSTSEKITPAVAKENHGLTREAQKLPELADMMYTKDRYDPDKKIDWEKFKRVLSDRWDNTKPIKMDKAPAHLARSDKIEEKFNPSFFIILTRDPYALCHSHSVKGNHKLEWSAREMAKFFRFMHWSTNNLQRIIVISYEYLTENPYITKEYLSQWVSELSDIDINETFTAHMYHKKITPMNKKHLDALSDDDIKRIKTTLKDVEKVEEEINYFEYKL